MNVTLCLDPHGAALVESGLGGPPGGGDSASLGWLWQTVGATCCWAISDVICDACIRPVPASTALGEPAKAELSPAAEKPAVCASVSAPVVCSSPTAAAGFRRRSRPKGLAPEVRDIPGGSALPGVPEPSSPNGLAPGMCQGLGLLAQSSGAFAEEAQEAPGRCRLTPEQNALVSGCVSLITVVLAGGLWGLGETHGEVGGAVAALNLHFVSAAVGGCVHFLAYLLTLCAFSSASSTVITPLMQLSAVWMLPFSTLAAALGFATFIRPVHLLSVMLICAGGFLPAADGSLSELATGRFWRQKAVRFVIMGELLVCFYNVLMHQATFNGGPDGKTNGDVGVGGIIRFFLVSRAANGLTCITMFLLAPPLRRHAKAMRFVSPCFLLASLVGECLSVVGVGLVTFSYSSFYEPSVVNAAEGGLQQLFNLLFALTSRHVLGWGREVDQLSVKCVSFALVAAGLTLSTA